MLSNVRVIDVALKYGYDSPESFAKAFKRAHGITPSTARESGVNLKAFPRISFHLSLKGDKDMDYRIIQKGAFQVIGEVIKVSTKDEGHHMKISELWDRWSSDGTYEKISAIDNKQNMLGISMDFDDEKEQFSYMIAIENVNHAAAASFNTREIPAASWAIFTSVGPMPDAIVNVLKRIYQEWFPATGYEQANAPVLEVYLPGDPTAQDYICEVWIPIIKK
jgi:AraC family transcriptional regulator